jgi:tetratricopeptide (TPR) repeat protein
MSTSDERLNQGWQLHQQGKFREAEQHYRQVLAIDPGNAAAWCYLGMACHDQERFDDAVFAFQQSIGLAPGMAVAYQNFGKTLGRMRRFDDSIACFDQAIALSPTYVNAYKNKAKAHYFKGDLDGAMAAHQAVLRLAPDDAETHMNIGMLWLLHNEAARGWPEYQWRWKTKDGALPPLLQPLWDGSSLNGKSILLTPEQGIGDCVQFIRYAAVLKERYGCRVVFHSPRSLMQLLQSCRGIDQLVEQTAPAPQTDCFAPLLHVPAVLGHSPGDFPGQVTYLSADESLVATWRERLAAYRGKKIGIAWRGSPKHPADRMRSIPLAQFAPLSSVPGVQIFSLQKGPGSEELASVAGQFKVIDLGRQLDEQTGAFVETSAVLKNLDLLVACDTAIVHVAAALGIPVWLAVGNVADWRWLLGRDDSPAYPSLRLFRQASFGDWPGVFQRIAKELGMRQ